MARECTSDRVLLSVHMQEHWKTGGFRPEGEVLEEVDEETEVNVQIGPKSVSMRYNSVIVHGFLPETELKDIHSILLSNGLPPEKLEDDILRKEKAGKINIENLRLVTNDDLSPRYHILF